MKNIYLLLSLVFFISFGSAFLGSYSQNSCVNIITISNATSVNLSSVTSPTTVYNIDLPMTKTGQTFNYTFCNTSELGYYNYYYHEDVGNVFSNNFLITTSGQELTVGVAVMYLGLLFGLLFFFLLCLYGAMNIRGGNERSSNGEQIGINYKKHAKLLLIVACYIFIVFIAGFLRSISASYLLFDNASTYFNYTYWILFVGIFPVIVVSFLFGLINWINDQKLIKAIERGVPMR